MKRTMSTLVVLGMIAAMLSLVLSSAGAQTGGPSGQITVVNGMARTVNATTVVNGTPIDLGSDLSPGEIGDPTVLPPGTYTIEFFDGNSVAATSILTLGEIEAWNVVAREGDSNAATYPIDFGSSTPAATVANSSAGDVTATPPGTNISETTLESLPNTDPFTLESTGSSVAVTPSTGTNAYTMVVAVGPVDGLNVIGVTIDDLPALRKTLEGTEPPTTTVPPSTTVPPTTTLPPSTTVPPTTIPPVVQVPDVVGQDVADATEILEAEGFVVEIAEVESDDVEAGLVIEMNPSAGTEVAEGTTVVLAVSTGPGDVVVPDFSGMTISEANATAEGVGLVISFVEDPNEPDPEGIVVSQDPEEGTMAEAGSEVVAQLSPKFDDAWTILVVDNDRELTVTGINFKFNTSTVSAVVDTTISQTTGVGQSGSWTTKIDISGLDDSEHFLQVTGTAEDGSAYEQTFKIPASGESTDQGEDAASESDGFPWWGWLIIGLLIAAVIAIGIKVFGGSGDDDGQTPGADTVPPPPPAVPPSPAAPTTTDG